MGSEDPGPEDPDLNEDSVEGLCPAAQYRKAQERTGN